MTPNEPTYDPEDRQFGASAAEDDELVAELHERGFEEQELPDEPARRPRPGAKALPDREPERHGIVEGDVKRRS